MDKGFILQTLASGVAIAALAGLAAWARIARPAGALDEAEARRLLAEEFPDRVVGPVAVSADGQTAVGRSGDEALILFRMGDGVAARSLPWREVAAADARDGVVSLRLRDVTAPRARFALPDGAAWPPAELAR